jgi:hypothetical protein
MRFGNIITEDRDWDSCSGFPPMPPVSLAANTEVIVRKLTVITVGFKERKPQENISTRALVLMSKYY